ncbi:hypothetical protein VNI00_004513 [Paramarasmius palmivorus]|uniref:Heme haloperoxidase family profile domain-containing protein n=1 Tax=Paramarasmius palmivorus TaxID=297713 RepID=A0AAW0DFE7_9AGAR
MQLTNLISFISSIALTTTNLHGDIDWHKHRFRAPTDGDLRGPCPGLNTLANHGFIPRNGRNMTIETVLKGSRDGFNVPSDFISAVAKIAPFTSNTFDGQFTLDDIKLHNAVEHDASLSRSDYGLGSNYIFNATLYNETLASSNPGVDYYNVTSAGLVQKARLADSIARNPNVRNTIKEVSIRSSESALYLCIMGGCADPETGKTPKKFVDIFFREERLPIEEGWTRASGDNILNTLFKLREDIDTVSEWSASPGQYPWIVVAPGAPDDPLKAGRIF